MTDGLRIQSNNYIRRDTAKGPDWVCAARHADQHETEQRGTGTCVAAEGIGEAKDGGGAAGWGDTAGRLRPHWPWLLLVP